MDGMYMSDFENAKQRLAFWEKESDAASLQLAKAQAHLSEVCPHANKKVCRERLNDEQVLEEITCIDCNKLLSSIILDEVEIPY